MNELTQYRTLVYDSARWDDVQLRDGDIIISTPPKSGTTWMQTLCAMLVLDTVEFDRPLAEISPWVDMQTRPLPSVVAGLEEQQHRRILKTHTPLDGIPDSDRVTYVCVGRDPRDAAVSFLHHMANLNMDAFMAARAVAVGVADLAEFGPPPGPPPADPNERFRAWAYGDDPIARTSLADTLSHLQTFWDRRQRPNVALFHYRDLLDDLPREIRRLAAVLQIPCTDSRVQEFAAAASIGAMRSRADTLIPDGGSGCFLSNEGFFRAGGSGQWREGLDDETLLGYADRVAALAPPDLATWAHNGWHGGSSHADGPDERQEPSTEVGSSGGSRPL